MKQNNLDIFVFAHWQGMKTPQLMGVLSADFAKGKKTFSFEYDKEWLSSKNRRLIDPDIQFFPGIQYPNNKENFGVFLDSMPDTWGRTLIKRKATIEAAKHHERILNLYDVDFLLGVFDQTRMGALRFTTALNGDFLDNDKNNPTPPWASVRELQAAVGMLEDDKTRDTSKWLDILIAPGSSLGGARPKANILDEKSEWWIAKFPSKNDSIDKGAWEYLAYLLACKAGINMSPCRIEKITGKRHTFFTKRFDRRKSERIHFASAMTMTGYNEDILKTKTASYLEIAEFMMNHGSHINENLSQLWRRIVFNICISNTDDHLRNHGFILTPEGWVLSPAYDLNPSADKSGLALYIDMENNSLSLDLAKEVGIYFRLNSTEMNRITREVQNSVAKWRSLAQKIGIPRTEQELMQGAFQSGGFNG